MPQNHFLGLFRAVSGFYNHPGAISDRFRKSEILTPKPDFDPILTPIFQPEPPNEDHFLENVGPKSKIGRLEALRISLRYTQLRAIPFKSISLGGDSYLRHTCCDPSKLWDIGPKITLVEGENLEGSTGSIPSGTVFVTFRASKGSHQR